MSDHGITKRNLLDVFPSALRGDPSLSATGETTAELLAKRKDEIAVISIYPHIDTLPEDLLDILAYDFKVDWWDANWGVEQKRRVFKTNWLVHKRLGTQWAVETALDAVYPGATVQSWFQYGGKPHYFTVHLVGTEATSRPTSEVRRLLDKVKRVSQWLDAVVLEYDTMEQSVHMGGLIGSVSTTPISNLPDDFNFAEKIRLGGNLGTISATTLAELEEAIP